MADSDERLLQRFAAQRVPNTALHTIGGRLPIPPKRQSQQAPTPAPRPSQAPKGAPRSPLAAQLMAEAQARKAAQGEAEASGGGNFLQKAAGKVLGNEAVETVLKPFEVLAYPGAAVTGTVRQALDTSVAEGLNKAVAALPGVEYSPIKNPEYDDGFDFGELWDDIKDKKGFGESVVEPAMGEGGTDRGIWTRRIAGLAGDLAADPLTYMTAGSSEFSGKTGRELLAVKGYEAGFDAKQMERAAKGIGYLNKEERAAVGARQAGVYFGHGENGLRLPGTELVGTGLNRAGNRVRGAIARRPWQTLADDADVMERATAVLNGRSDEMSKVQAAGVLAYSDVKRGIQNTVAAEGKLEAQKVLHGLDEVARQQLTHDTELGETALTAVNRRMREIAEQHGLDMGTVDNYMTHMLSKEGQAFMEGPSEAAQELRKLFTIDETGAGGVVLKRDFLSKGEHKAFGQKLDFGNGTIKEIEAELQRVFKEAGVPKFMEDDAARLMSYSVHSMGENVGRVAGFKHLAEVRRADGVVRWLDDVPDTVLKGVKDSTANKEMRVALEDELARRSEMLKVEKKASKVNARKLQTRIVDKLQEDVDRLEIVDAPLRDALRKVKADGKTLGEMRREVGKVAQEAKDALLKQRADLSNELHRLERQIEAAQVKFATVGDTGVIGLEEQRAKLQQLMEAGNVAEQHLDDLTSTIADVTHVSEQLAARGDDPDFVNSLLAEMDAGEDAATQLGTLDSKVAKALAPKEARQGAIASQHESIAKQIEAVDAKAAADYRELDQMGAALEVQKKLISGDREVVEAELKRVRGLRNRASAIPVGRNSFNHAKLEFEDLVKALPDDPDLAPTVALLDSYVEHVAKLTTSDEAAKSAEAFLAAAKKGKLNTAFRVEARKGWTDVMDGLLPEGERMVAQDEFVRAVDRVVSLSEDGQIWKSVDALTQFFKTYATATPGFHVRNAMSAAFMNATQGVGLKRTVDAIKMWKQMRANPTEFLSRIEKDDPQLFKAFQATFGSGAGGRVSHDELSRMGNSKAFNNIWTRNVGVKPGEWVEGPARLALAMDVMEKEGASMTDALARITQIHFDYSKVTTFDRKMKRLIPFWTFMSRNLPLQMHMIFQRPAMYSAYNNVTQELSAGNEFDGVPAWLAASNPISMGSHVTDDGATRQDMLALDLPHLNIAGDVSAFNPNNDPLGALSNLNPVMVSLAEALSNKDFYYDEDLKGNRAMHVARSVFSPIAQGERLAGKGTAEGKMGEKWLNFFGVPYKGITEEQIAREMQRRA